MVALSVDRGVPDTTPVVVLRASPVGRAGVIENVLLPGTSVTVKAVVGVIAAPAVAFTVCVDGVSAGAAWIVETEIGAKTDNIEIPITSAIPRHRPDLFLNSFSFISSPITYFAGTSIFLW